MPENEAGGGPDERGGGPVHYQISITGRQAASFFFALLIALGLAFFFGMKTGAAARKGEPRVAVVADEPTPAGEKGAQGAAENQPPPTEVAEKKLGFDEGPQAGKPGPNVSETPRAPVERKPTPHPTVAPAATPKNTPAEPLLPEEARPREPTATPATAKKESALFVQVLATQNAATADEMAKKLRKVGFKADVSLVPRKPGWFRVRVGPYADRAKAEAAAKKLVAADRSIKKPIIVP